jgi:hypothetical protein
VHDVRRPRPPTPLLHLVALAGRLDTAGVAGVAFPADANASLAIEKLA